MPLSRQQVEAAYVRFGHLVLQRCRGVVREPSLAEDALHEVFLRVWRYGDGFLEASAPLRWLYRVADTVCLDMLSARRRREERLVMHPAQVSEELPEARHEDRDQVLRLLARFEVETARIALLYFCDGMTQDEVAQELGLSRQTVNRKLSWLTERARQLRTLGVV